MAKVEGSSLCPKGWALRETYNHLQRANGTSMMRHVRPSQEESKAADEYDMHLMTCKECAE